MPIDEILLRALMRLEAIWLKRNGWKRSTLRGIEPMWVSPPGVKVVPTELGIVICCQYDAVHYQRGLSNRGGSCGIQP